MKSLLVAVALTTALGADLAAQRAPEAARWLEQTAERRAQERESAAAVRSDLARIEDTVLRSPIVWQDGHGALVQLAHFSPDGKLLLSWGTDGLVQMWDAWTGNNVGTLGHHSTRSVRISFSPNGEWVLIYDRPARRATLWDGRSTEFVAPIGDHDVFLEMAVFTSDSRRIATVDDEGIVRLWDVASADFLAAPVIETVGLPRPAWPALVCTPGEDSLWVVGEDHTARRWNTRTGGLEATIGGKDEPVTHAWLTAAGTRLITFGRNLGNRLAVWSLEDPPRLLLSKPCSAPVQFRSAPRWSASGRRLATFDRTAKQVQIWDVERSKLLHAIDIEDMPITCLAVSADGALVAAGARDGRIALWDCRTGERIGGRELAADPELRDLVARLRFRPDSRLLLAQTGWARTNMVALAADTGWRPQVMVVRDGSINGMDFDPAGRRFAVMGYNGHGEIFDTFGVDARVPIDGHAIPIGQVFVSRDGKTAVSGARHDLSMAAGGIPGTGAWARARVWDPATGRDLRRLEGLGNARVSEFSPDGRFVAITGLDPTWVSGQQTKQSIGLFDLHGGKLVKRLGVNYNTFTGGAAFSPDGARLLVTLRYMGTAGMYDLQSGTLECRFDVSKLNDGGHTPDAVFSQSGAFIVSAGPQGTLEVRDGRTGEPVRSERNASDHTARIRHLTFGPDDRLLATSGLDNTTKLWDPKTWTVQRTLPHAAPVWHAAFNRDGTRLVTACTDGVARIWDTAADVPPILLRGHSGWVRFTAFTPSAGLALTCGTDGTIRSWDGTSGEPKHIFEGHTGPVEEVRFLPDSDRMLTRSTDATVRIWDYRQGRLLLTRVEYADDDWLVFDPSGHYTGTDTAATRARIRVNGRHYPLASYAAVFHKPEKVAAVMQGQPVRPPARLPTAPEVVVTAPSSDSVPSRAFDLALLVDDAYGIDRIRVWQDDAEIPQESVEPNVQRKRAGRATKTSLSLRLRMPASKNVTSIRIQATNRRGILSRPTTLRVVHEPRARHLYVLAFGVADYGDDSLDLRYPTKDVTDLVKQLQSQTPAVFAEVHVEQLLNEAVTPGALKRLRSTFLQKARPDDTIVVFAAGHGVHLESDGYYFLTSDTTPADPYNGVDRALLESLVLWDKLHARSRLLLIDTCNAGTALPGRSGDERGRAVYRQDAVNKFAMGGLYVMAATAEIGRAREQEGNGLFTRAVLEGLAGGADRQGNGDKQVDVDELLVFVKNHVLEATRGKQVPTIPRIEGGQGFVLSRVAR